MCGVPFLVIIFGHCLNMASLLVGIITIIINVMYSSYFSLEGVLGAGKNVAYIQLCAIQCSLYTAVCNSM